GLETSVIEVAGADGAPLAVDGHDFLMQERVRVLEQPHTAPEQLLEVAVPGVLHHRVVRTAGRRHQHTHIDAALYRSAKSVDRIGLGNEVRVLDPDALARK